jgi:hypothetical protein
MPQEKKRNRTLLAITLLIIFLMIALLSSNNEFAIVGAVLFFTLVVSSIPPFEQKVKSFVKVFFSSIISPFTRRKEQKNTKHEAPIYTYKKPIVVPMMRGVLCGICLGSIKDGLEVIVCNCGKIYHKSCVTRVGECPNCEQLITKEMIVNDLKEGFIEEIKFQCPICNAFVDIDAEKCECGAVFSENLGCAFRCPACDEVVDIDEISCKNCGLGFFGAANKCPICGAGLDADAARCDCGARFSIKEIKGFYCPECGIFQNSESIWCSGCGAVFFDVEDEKQKAQISA